jgi:hypothetical protein
LTFISAVTFLSTLASTTDIDFSETASIAFNQQSSSLSITLIVVPNGHANLLGFKTVQNMGLITVNNDRFIANVVVQEIGDLGVAILQVNDEVKPKTLPSRKLPLSLQDDVKREIDKLVERNVLVPVTEPTEWVKAKWLCSLDRAYNLQSFVS